MSKAMETASREYEAAYREYEAATKMNVPTPEGVGSFGGVWDCDESRLLRALVLAVRCTLSVCSPAAEKVARGEAITVSECGYDNVADVGADVYRTPNGSFRDADGRYLTSTEAGLVTRGLHGRSVIQRSVSDTEWNRYHAHYYTAGCLTQRWIEERAGSQIANTLTKPYLVGWPVCSDAEKVSAYNRVRDIYRTLTAAFADTHA